MRVLAINCGSSSLKFAVMEVTERSEDLSQQRQLAVGAVGHIGEQAEIDFSAETGEHLQTKAALPDHEEATRRALAWLGSIGLIENGALDAVGHRVVHGGDRFDAPVRLEERVMEAIESLTELAPLHNTPALHAIRAARDTLGPAMPMVATFDTTFHRTMPDRAAHYAIPLDLAQEHQIRRYGFHGLAHRFMAERVATLAGTPLDHLRLITLQLGSGCSAAAIQAGRSVDTSMGFTPLEGLMMGTRSGDLDPSLPAYLAQHTGVRNDTVENWLNTSSGLLGVSGLSADMRELTEAAGQGNARAALAIEIFCYRVRKQIGAYLAVLGGADAIVFGGGIGEHQPAIRASICTGMEWCGLVLDLHRNAGTGTEARISADHAAIGAYVIPVDEARVIARDTLQCLRR